MAIKTINIYKTNDGLTFNDLNEAKKHEQEINANVNDFKKSIKFQATINYIIARLKAEEEHSDFNPDKMFKVDLYSFEVDYEYPGTDIQLMYNSSLSTIYGIALKEVLENDYHIHVIEDQYYSGNSSYITFETKVDDFAEFE